jgi:deazaflavin-dependent oxidoreductase (nitroreductase family)
MKKIRDVKPPRGLARLLFKLPNVFYNLGLGSLMGARFLQLAHVGRKSGKQYKTVIEVVKYDPAAEKVHVASGFKERSDWLKNIEANPDVEINLKGSLYHALAKRLDIPEAQDVLLEYAHKHPLAMRELAKFMGYQVDGSDEDILALADELPIIEFQLSLKD